MTIYRIGTGIADITDCAIGTGMQGMADPSQKITGVESRLYARAFVIAEAKAEQYIAIVNAELLMGTQALKAEVLRRLQRQTNVFDENNVIISATHTHSAPGGYSDHRLYEHIPGGFDPHTFECIVVGIVRAIQNAYANLAPGKIYLNKGIVEDCGRQRSCDAYHANPQAERDYYGSDTDKEMLLLKFVALEKRGERPLGVLTWYAIHPTDRGQKNTLISGDNKGYASWLFEKQMGTNSLADKTFVAAFANSNCGDVSGNVEFGTIPDGITDKDRMELHGKKQYEAAKALFDSATEELSGSIDTRHTRVDMSDVAIEEQPGKRTYPGALGLAFTGASTQDSIPRINIGSLTMTSICLSEGLIHGEISLKCRTAQAIITKALALTFGYTNCCQEFVQGHLPKPLVIATGLLNPPATPNVLPLQILKIGNLAIVAIPAEITTMAGRRLRATVLDELKEGGIDTVALATYANDYSQYITTKEEYDRQHYEGASTLFGPYTLLAYQQEFRKLARALKTGSSVASGPNAPVRSAPTKRRITIRNMSGSKVVLKFFKPSDTRKLFHLRRVPFAKLVIPPNSERAYFLPKDIDEAKVYLNNGQVVEHVHLYSLLTIASNGTAFVSSYEPPYSVNYKAQNITTGTNTDEWDEPTLLGKRQWGIQ